MKKCGKCKIKKDQAIFSPSEFKKGGGWCKVCVSEYKKKYLKENREAILIKKKIYRDNNKEQISQRSKIYYDKNRELLLQYQKQYRANNKEKLSAYHRKYYQGNKSKINKRNNIYRHNNKDKINLYFKKKRETNPTYKIRTMISTKLNKVLRKNSGSKNGQSISKYILWTPNEFRSYFELLFCSPENLNENGKVWMTWDNWTVYDPMRKTWHLDHIIPQSDLPFDSMKHPNFAKCWALENLRPLLAHQNITDGARRTRHKKKDKV